MISPPTTTLSLDDVLAALDGVRKCGDGYVARCPAHHDRQPSLSVGLGDDGRTILLHCHAGCTFEQIRAALPLDGRLTAADGGATPILAPPPPPAPPCGAWQLRADQFVAYSVHTLWTSDGREALAGLRRRGFDDETLHEARVGYNPRLLQDNPIRWGMAESGTVVLPQGIVLPWSVDDALWNVEIRRLDGSPKYHSIRGGRKAAMLGVDNLRGLPAVLVEGFFDWLALHQVAGDIVTPVALGSTGTARHVQWIIRLAALPLVLVALDADGAGAAAADWWLGALPNAKLWRPDYDDPAAMLQAGADLRAWVQAGLATPPPPEDNPDPCVACGGPLHRYLPSGRPACERHYDELLADEVAAATANARAEARGDLTVHVRGRSNADSGWLTLPALLTIPKRTREARCASCKAPIYWIFMPSGKMAPVSVDTTRHPKCVAPTHDAPGYGINHFVNCPSAAQHRKEKAAP